MTPRKASEISKTELVNMIAHLRGAIYEVLPKVDDFFLPDLEEVLDETIFDNDLSKLSDHEGSQESTMIEVAQERPAWVVYINTDLTEGRGAEYPVHVCTVQATAHRLAKGAGVQGTDASVSPSKIMRFAFPDLRQWDWYGPVKVVPPSTQDMKAQGVLDRRQEVIERLKASGASDEDLKVLMQR